MDAHTARQTVNVADEVISYGCVRTVKHVLISFLGGLLCRVHNN